MVNRIMQNIKVVKIMKSCGYKDVEIANYLGMHVGKFLELIDGDSYLKEVYESAGESLASDIEKLFLENLMNSLEKGDNTDAKWFLERRVTKYNPKQEIKMDVKSIDEIINAQVKTDE